MARRALRLAVVVLVVACSPASAASVAEIFQKAKSQFASKDYAEALKSLDALAIESEKPENAAIKTQLLPAMAFYRGATLAEMGKKSEARASFESFLEAQPGAGIDPAVFSKKVVASFEDAKKVIARKSGGESSVTEAYKSFPAPESIPVPDERWADGPIRYLMTADQLSRARAIGSPADRAAYAEEFWHARDPKPETSVNEAALEFHRRVAFADRFFAQGEKRGSDTDRGMVFILLGPPSYGGRKPLDVKLSGFESETSNLGVSETDYAPLSASMQATNSRSEWMEVWHYRMDLLPKNLPSRELDAVFVTKKGYGENVLQRDQEVLAALEAGRRAPGR
ncbi:MAG TPA: GWxTD domain-containing protein [Thermoanaerobaculia bacterium]|jgi:GWxTD domain-containing protein